MGVNYLALEEKLLEVNEDPQVYSFEQIEEIIGEEIPSVYIDRRTFKQKSSSRFQQHAMNAGYLITEVDYDNRVLTFRKIEGFTEEELHRGGGNHQHHYTRHAVRLGISEAALDPEDVGKELESAITAFKANWRSTGASSLYVAFRDRFDTLEQVYYHAGNEAYRASVKNRWKLFYITKRQINELREQSVRYLAGQFAILFQMREMSIQIFNNWAYETATRIRQIYHDGGVNLYTYGHAQKIINVAIKFVLSSDLVDYHNEIFRVCQFPVDGRIQDIIKSELGVHLLNQNNVQMFSSSSWSKNDHWEDFLDYQARVREATDRYGYYSPLIWEATHWH